MGLRAEWDFGHEDLAAAAADYERAVRANPNSEAYWLELAGIHEKLGDATRAEQDYSEARLRKPTSAEAAWEEGNFLLRRGDAPAACLRFRMALRSDAKYTEGALAACSRIPAYRGDKIAGLLPPDIPYYSRALEYFRNQEQWDASLAVWDAMAVLPGRLDLAQIVPLVDGLISARRPVDAERVWRQALAGSPWAGAVDEGRSLVFNGGFERDFLQGGFDWRTQSDPGISFDFDLAPAAAHSGKRCLRLRLDAQSNLDFQNLVQYVAVEPKHSYLLSAYFRSDSLPAAEFHFVISDPSDSRLADAVTPSPSSESDWTEVRARFVSGAASWLVKLTLRRFPGAKHDERLRGTLWIDDVSLTSLAARGEPERP